MKKKWTTQNIPDQTGRTVIITGASSGIGFETALALAGKGAYTVLACRNPTKAMQSVERIKRTYPHAHVTYMQLNLDEQSSVRACAEQFSATNNRLDLLINNAGIMAVPYALTTDGFETQFGTNYLGHFTLTGLLMPLLLRTHGSRVITVASNAHSAGTLNFDNLMDKDGIGYHKRNAYRRSKLANLVFSYQLHRMLTKSGSETKSIAAHPGVSRTGIAYHLKNNWKLRPLVSIVNACLQSASMGALPILRAATDSEAQSGTYYGPEGKRQIRGYPCVVQSNETSLDEKTGCLLWSSSETLTNLTYPLDKTNR